MEPKRISLTAMRTLAFGALVWCLAYSASAAAAEVNCRSCHGKLGKEKVQHAALGMGCLTCHAAIDASAMPHKKTNTIARGLTAEQPDLCYGCHDAAMFSKKTVHAAVGMGCTGCAVDRRRGHHDRCARAGGVPESGGRGTHGLAAGG